MIENKAIAECIHVVIAYSKTVQDAELGTLPCIFYIHGGCRYGGTPYTGYLERAREWATYFNAIAVSVDYRLSPSELDESPTGEEPTNDCFNALTWIYHQLGANEDDILKSLGDLYGLVLEAPQLDDRCNTQSHKKFKKGNMFTSEDALQGWNASLGTRRGTENVSIYESPARASDADVQGFPPSYIDVGTAEPFRDEAENFCNTLRKARVDVEMNSWEGGYHGFFTAVPDAPISQLCNLAKLKWLCQRLGVQDKNIEKDYNEVKKAYDARHGRRSKKEGLVA
ncbi:hypothetical protein ONZ43_g1068 [Nemania bipapillata]|uniref:Uncharacterized protein n=1 Tax=Nemania bipapillata TaxID=110536 RepID=A0ACC2J675_9PEZI|nr:hypothetical protein ONZ43_g1068 [Nemania bipapillata]